MNQQPPSLKFDHREIAVIFSLFIFVSLLMFTVGILVGKGLSQAKYSRLQGTPLSSNQSIDSSDPDESSGEASKGNSVSTDSEIPGESPAAAANTKTETPAATPAPAPEASTKVQPTEVAPVKAAAEPSQLKLTPQKFSERDSANSLLEPSSHRADTDKILKNPKIQALLEEDTSIKRVPSALGNIPQSFEKGKFTVQVGSYPTEHEAQERIDSLKKLGFPYAHFSAKQLPGSSMKSSGLAAQKADKVETWYRVWIGEYPDYESANESGRALQDRGEVKHYLVRKSDTTG